MIAKRTTYALALDSTLKEVETALAQLRADGAPDAATVTFFLGGYGPQAKAEWEVVEPDHAEPAADTRQQPTTVQPDGLVNETPVK